MAIGRNVTPLKYRSVSKRKSPLKGIFNNSPLKGSVRRTTQKEWQTMIEGSRGTVDTAMANFMNVGKPGQEAGITNLYEDVQNPMAGLQNAYEGMTNPYANLETQFENVFEDLTVDQKAAEFQQKQFAQSQANVLDQMKQMGKLNVQQLVNTNVQQSAAAASDIGKQESENQMAKARGARDVQSMEQAAQEKVMKGAFDVDVMTRKGEWEKEMQTRQGEWMADQARLQGAADARNMDLQKQQGLLAFQQGKLESEQAAKQADKNWFQRTFSDRKLKHNIVLIGKSPSGLNIYHFEYKDSKLGEGVYQGVMSDEISSSAVVKHPSGYDMVDYNKIDVDFIKIKN